MRITEATLYQRTLDSANTAMANLARAQGEVSTGLRVQAPGDDPQAAGMLVRHRFDQARTTAIQSGAQRATEELNAADSALGSLGTTLARAQVLATQFGNDTYTASDRAAAAAEVDGLFQQGLADLNIRFGDRFIFGGNKDNQTPFGDNGVYRGDAGIRQVEVAPGVYEQSSVRADIMAAGAGGGVDVLQTLKDLAAALRADDSGAVRGTLSGLSDACNQISTARSQVGTSVNIFTSAVDTCASQIVDTKQVIGELGDADVMDASSRLSLAQYALNATLTAAKQTLSFSLVDLMK